MTDIADTAAALQATLNASAIQNKKAEAPAYAGHCLYCGEPTPYPRRWCDAQCRDDWSKQHDTV